MRNDPTQVASGDNATICGGLNNTASGVSSGVVSGQNNQAFGNLSFVGSGLENTASSFSSGVVSGIGNVTSGDFSGVVSGAGNIASGNYSGVVSGIGNVTSGDYTFASGQGVLVDKIYQAAFGPYNDPTNFMPANFPQQMRRFMIGGGTFQSRSNLFTVTSSGNAFALGAFQGGGADFAEYIESVSGEKLPVGEPVVLIDGKVALAREHTDLTPIGVISNTAGFVGNNPEYWHGKFLRDEDGNIIYENVTIEHSEPVMEEVEVEVSYTEKQMYQGKEIEMLKTRTEKQHRTVMDEIEVHNENHEVVHIKQVPRMQTVTRTERVMKINPEYDADRPYALRSDRPEWNCVGFLGQVKVLKEAPVSYNWIRMKEVDSRYDLYLLK